MKRSGFTLVELMIVVAIIGIIAAIALSGWLRYRANANETNSCSTLRSVASAEQVFQKGDNVDQDEDGCGEFGTLGELTSYTPLRGRNNKAGLAFLPAGLQPMSLNHYNSRAGYTFQVYLPGSTAPITDNGEDATTVLDKETDSSAIQSQESKWFAYSWPQNRITGFRAFFVDASADVFTIDNNKSLYESTRIPMEFRAIFKTGDPADDDALLCGEFAIQSESQCIGNEPWTPVQ